MVYTGAMHFRNLIEVFFNARACDENWHFESGNFWHNKISDNKINLITFIWLKFKDMWLDKGPGCIPDWKTDVGVLDFLVHADQQGKLHWTQDLLLFCLKLIIEPRLTKNKCTVSVGYYDTFTVLTQVCSFSFHHLNKYIIYLILNLRKKM